MVTSRSIKIYRKRLQNIPFSFPGCAGWLCLLGEYLLMQYQLLAPALVQAHGMKEEPMSENASPTARHALL